MAEVSATRKRRAIPVIVLALLCAGAAHAQLRGPEPYGKWWTTCDNTKACAVYGTGGDDGVAVTVMVRRGPAPQDPVRISLIADGPRAPTSGADWRLTIDGRPAGVARARSGQVMIADLPPVEAAILIGRMIEGRELQLEGGGGGRLGLAGADAALRRMDQEQGRAGGVTALAARGSIPANAVPPAPRAPVIEVGALPAQVGLPSDSPLGRLDRRRCQNGREPMGTPQVYRLGDDALLWLVPCGRADRGQALVLLSDGRGDQLRPALGGHGKGESVEARFDPRQAMLTAYESSYGLTDCGRGVDYVWTGGEFRIVREREMIQCVGLPRELWPDTYRAVVRRAS
jgi:hypothetical protein